MVSQQGRRQRGSRRLLLVRRARRRRDHRGRLPDRPVRGRVGLHRAPGGARGRGCRLARRGAGQRGQGVHRPRRGRRALRRARRRDQGLRARAAVRLRLPAADRVHRRAAQDPDRQDPPDRAARGGAGRLARALPNGAERERLGAACRQPLAVRGGQYGCRGLADGSLNKPNRPRYARDGAEFDRAIAFVDATFALALTLLVTTLDIDDPAEAWRNVATLADAVGQQFGAFVIAFIVIASYWLAHHRLIGSFTALDVPVIVANLGLIAAIVLLPFTTASVGDPAVEDLALPTILMAVNVAAATACYALIYAMAVRRGLLASRPSRRQLRADFVDILTPAAVFLASVPVAALASPGAARLVWLSLAVIGPVVGRLTARARGATVEA
ncbi:MAG: DUF1211 domain-containing protein [Solirubrobacterales bacterium]|nr:DUF1211 domain-containing protein [Solirubrobacterales bacterium]